jgi:hypothetical protein
MTKEESMIDLENEKVTDELFEELLGIVNHIVDFYGDVPCEEINNLAERCFRYIEQPLKSRESIQNIVQLQGHVFGHLFFRLGMAFAISREIR